MDGKRELTVRQSRFVQEMISGVSAVKAAENAGYKHPASYASTILHKPAVREAMSNALATQGLTPEYLAAKVRDLCEASDGQPDGRTTPNWTARYRGASVLMTLLGVDRHPDVVTTTYEESISRIWEQEQEAKDTSIEIIDIDGEEKTSNYTQVFILDK
ncbi:MAG: terminase small subunit [Spirochaetaceae bacterium]|nr:terminase small subunit [Spirochaetaceae bacterium]